MKKLFSIFLLMPFVLSGCGGGSGSPGASSSTNPPSGGTTVLLGGTISGLSATGLTLKDAQDTLSVPAGTTSFAMPTRLSPGSNYSVSIANQPSTLHCTLSNNTGTMPDTDYMSISVVCTPDSSGTVFNWSQLTPIFVSGATQTYVPAIASLPNNGLVASFTESDANGISVYSVIGNNANGTWGTPTKMTGYTGTPQYYTNVTGPNQGGYSSAVAVNAVTGDAIAAWFTQVSTETNYRVWISKYTASTQTWSSAIQIGTSSSPASLLSASNGKGGMVFAWLQSSTVTTGNLALGLYLVDPSGNSSTDTLELNTVTSGPIKIGLDDNNVVSAVWQGSNSDPMLAILGQPSWSAPIDLGYAVASDSFNLLSLAVAPDGSGGMVAWTVSSGSTGSVVRTASFDSAGGLLSSGVIDPAGSTNNAYPALAYMGNGKYIAVFGSSSLGGSSILYYIPYSSIFDPTSGWSSPLMMDSTGPGGVGHCQVKVDANGNAIAIIHAYNQGAFLLPAGASSWTSLDPVEYNGAVPSFALNKTSGYAAIIWAYNNEIVGDYYNKQ